MACGDLRWDLYRVSIPTALRLGGIGFEQVVDERDGGRILYRIGGELMTPGEAADRYLMPNGERGWIAR